MFFYSLQANAVMLVYLVLFAVKTWALVDAILRPPQGFVATDRLTKQAWLWLLGITLAAHLLLPSLVLNLIGTVAALVYLLDVKPAIAEITRRR